MNKRANKVDELKVALVGCGQIADAHLQEVRKIAGARLVAVCDRHRDLAEQAAARFGVLGIFQDIDEMLATARPDVVHITTPPQSHYALAQKALLAGAHVYVEKPFTVDAAEADEVLRIAAEKDRLACVGHDQLFDPAWEECRRRHERGEFGRIVHIESILGYPLDGPFGRVFTSERDHWLHCLPGGLFHNTVSQALYRITDFLPDESPRVWATWFGEEHGGGTPTELRVLLRGAEATASLTFTCQARPLQRVTRLYGTKGGIEVDLEGRVLRRQFALRWPGPFAKIEAPYRHLREAFRSLVRNTWRFLRCQQHYFAGMNRLFTLFYRSIREGTPPPIPHREIRRVTALMDEIFQQCQKNADTRAVATPDEPRPAMLQVNGSRG
jgi:predicted dehydrogenase